MHETKKVPTFVTMKLPFSKQNQGIFGILIFLIAIFFFPIRKPLSFELAIAKIVLELPHIHHE